MKLVISDAVVLNKITGAPPCLVLIQWCSEETIGVSLLSCELKKAAASIIQGEDKRFYFVDGSSLELGNAIEITVDVWEKGINGVSLISAALTREELILINDNTFALDITSAQSLTLPIGTHYLEVWAITADGKKVNLAIGRFSVIDSRKHDA